MKSLIFQFVNYLLIVFFVVSCNNEIKEGFEIDPGNWETSPLLNISVEDGEGNWINGEINELSVTFHFRMIENLTSVKFKYECLEGWMVMDNLTELNLNDDKDIIFSNGKDKVCYRIKGVVDPWITNVLATANGETIEGQFDENVTFTFIFGYLDNEDVIKIHDLSISDFVEVVTPSIEEMSNGINYSKSSNVLDLVLKDRSSGNKKTFKLKFEKSIWNNVTEKYSSLLPEGASIYEHNRLLGIPNNHAFVINIPSGHINMTSYAEEKQGLWSPTGMKTVSEVVQSNSEQRLFVSGMDVYVWYPRFHALSMNDNVITTTGYESGGYLEWGFKGTTYKVYNCPPTLYIDEYKKAHIVYAQAYDDGLYSFGFNPQNALSRDEFKSSGEKISNVLCAVSGYSMPLQNGLLIEDLEGLAQKERYFDTFKREDYPEYLYRMEDEKNYYVIDGKNNIKLSAVMCDEQRSARVMLGVTDKGDLLILISERYTGEKSKNNSTLGDPEKYPSVGVTMLEAAKILKEDWNCVNAIQFDHVQRAVCAFNDNGNAKEVTKTDKYVQDSHICENSKPNKDGKILSAFMMFK